MTTWLINQYLTK